MITANARYFDGKSSKAVPCTIITDENGIYLTLLNDEAESFDRISLGWSELLMYEYISQGKSSFKFGSFPHQEIETADPELQKQIEKSFDKRKLTMRLENSIRRYGLKGALAGVGIIISIVLIWYFFIMPGIAYRALELTPSSVDKQIGKSYYESLKTTLDIDEKSSEALQKYYNALGYPNTDSFKVMVVHADIMNAFALPGGYIVVYDKLLKSIHSEEQLAGLLAHESIHVLHRHSMQIIYNNISSNLIVGVLTSNSSGFSSAAIGNAGSMLSLKYSRGKETEADTAGQEMMCKAGVADIGMVSLFEELQGKSRLDIPDFLTTHPGLDKRIEYLKKLPHCSGNPDKEHNLSDLFINLKIIVNSHS